MHDYLFRGKRVDAMIAISTYSGECDGLGYAAEMAGVEVAAYCEADPKRRAQLAKKHPGKPIFESDTELTKDAIESLGIRADILFGGPPCQPFSVAGAGRGTDDPRHRWPQMRRFIQEYRPRWVIVENVGGFVNLALDLVWSDLEAEGYETGTVVLPALAVGAPHRRDRCFVLAYTNGHGQVYGEHAINATKWNKTQPEPASGSEIVANAHGQQQDRSVKSRRGGARPSNGSSMGDPISGGQAGHEWRGSDTEFTGRCAWAAQSRLGGVLDGISRRTHEVNSDDRLEFEKKGAAGLSGNTPVQDLRKHGERAEASSESSATNTCDLSLPDMPQERTRSNGHMGAWNKTAETMQGVRKTVLSKPFKESQHMQQGMFECNREDQCAKALEQAEKRLTATLERVSAQLDEQMSQWPAWRGQEQYAWEPSRTITGMEDRPRRIESLGLAVVPWVPYPIFALIKEMDTILRGGGEG